MFTRIENERKNQIKATDLLDVKEAFLIVSLFEMHTQTQTMS